MKPLKSTLKTQLALLCLGLLTAGQTQAAIITWSGASGANWTTNSSWTGSVPPVNDTTTDTAQFTVATSGTVNLSAVRSVAALDIQRDTTFSGSQLTLNGTAGVTNLTLAAGKTAVFNNAVVSASGNRTLGSGSTLTFNGTAVPTGGIYNMTAATVNFGGYVSTNTNPLFTGTGMVNYTSTTSVQGSMRFSLDGVDFTFKQSSSNPTSSTGTSCLDFTGTTALYLGRDVDFVLAGGNAAVNSVAQTLGVGYLVATSAAAKATNLTISGAFQAKFNQLHFEANNNQTTTLDGSTLLIGGNLMQGVFSTTNTGGASNVTANNRVFTITSTANGGTVRVGANATSSFNASTSATTNYGAKLLVSGNATLINNGVWTNKNYTTNATLTGLQVDSTATLGGNGSFDMGATAAGTLSAKNAMINGSIAPGDGGIGTLTINGGNVTLSGTAKYELGTAGVSHGAPGTSDRLVVSGALTLGGTLNLIDNAGANGNGSAGAGSYQIFTQAGAAGGSFTTINNIAGYHAKVDTATSGSVFVDNYQIASANATQTVNVGNMHAGGTKTASVTLFNTAPANVTYTETLASNGFSSISSNFTATGSVSGIAGGSSGSGNLTVGLGSGLAVGVVSGTTSLALNSNAVNSSGLGTTALTAQTITITGQVYSGNMVWNGSSGNYGTDSNWNDTSNAGVHVAPGLDAAFTTVDSATFGNTSGSVTVTLNGSSPSLNTITFNNTGSYTLAQGSGGNITLAGTTPSITANGTHAISAPITLAVNATMNATAGSNLAVSGVIGETGGARSLTKGGTGTLALSGNNTYSGPTNVTAGTLLANNTSGSATGSGNVTVASGATLGGIGTTGGATTIAGILSPGDGGIGTLNITGNVTWQGASSNGTATDWIFQLGASPTSDLLNITGDFLNDTGAGTNFRFNFEGATNTGTFKVVDWSGTSSFIASDFSYTNLGSGLTGSFSINDSQLDFSVLPAVPEPSTWVAMAALIITGGTMAMHRRTRQARFFRNPKSARKNAGRRERGSTNDIGKGGASPSAPLLWQRGCRGRHPAIDCAYARIRGNGRLLTGDTSACRIVLF